MGGICGFISQKSFDGAQFGDLGKSHIVYDGTIYNIKEIREELQQLGYAGDICDADVLLNAYFEWKEGFLARISGSFALAVYDCRDNSMFFARDRIGKKHLFYYFDNGLLIFASELKSIIKHTGFKKEIRTEAIAKYLCNAYIDAQDTIFKNTFKLEPGCYMTWSGGKLQTTRYYSYTEKFEAAKNGLVHDFTRAKSELSALIEASVAERLTDSLPAGVFLSGGIDSNIVAGTMSKLSGKPIKSFTIGFNAKERDEAPRAREIAKYLGAEHTELYIDGSELLDLISYIPDCLDEPLADASLIPTMVLCRLAKRDVDIALAGDGGDEFFCGYKMYDWLYWAQKLDKPARLLNGALSLPGVSGIRKSLPNIMRALLKNKDKDYKVQLFADVREEFVKDIVKHKYSSLKFDIEKNIPARNWQEKRMLLDIAKYLPDAVLTKVDKASVWHGLEVRCPLLDRRVSEYSFKIPHKFKYRNGEKKWILKQIAYDLVPQKLLDMPKNGFGVPLAKWLRGPLKTLVERYINKEILAKQGFFSYEPLLLLVSKVEGSNSSIYSTALWGYLVFQMWYQKNIEDLWGRA